MFSNHATNSLQACSSRLIASCLDLLALLSRYDNDTLQALSPNRVSLLSLVDLLASPKELATRLVFGTACFLYRPLGFVVQLRQRHTPTSVVAPRLFVSKTPETFPSIRSLFTQRTRSKLCLSTPCTRPSTPSSVLGEPSENVCLRTVRFYSRATEPLSFQALSSDCLALL
jgi:hypothetical protein